MHVQWHLHEHYLVYCESQNLPILTHAKRKHTTHTHARAPIINCRNGLNINNVDEYLAKCGKGSSSAVGGSSASTESSPSTSAATEPAAAETETAASSETATSDATTTTSS